MYMLPRQTWSWRVAGLKPQMESPFLSAWEKNSFSLSIKDDLFIYTFMLMMRAKHKKLFIFLFFYFLADCRLQLISKAECFFYSPEKIACSYKLWMTDVFLLATHNNKTEKVFFFFFSLRRNDQRAHSSRFGLVDPNKNKKIKITSDAVQVYKHVVSFFFFLLFFVLLKRSTSKQNLI